MSGSVRSAVIVADGDGVPAALPVALAEAAATGPRRPFVIAADGGARRALDLGVTPDLVVGDGDSIGPDISALVGRLGVAVELSPADKDESDAELCVRAALARGATTVLLVGALGGRRVEHAIANLLLLAHPMLDGITAAIVAPPSRIWRIGRETAPGASDIEGTPGDHVSLLPVDSVVEGVVTDGLRFPLRGEPLRPGPARGLSNELLASGARVTTRHGRLLIIHTTPAGTPPEDHP